MRGWICIVCIFLTGAGRLFSQNAFEKQLNDLLAQPEYRHALAGIQITDANRGSVVYEMNSEKLFIPASVIKLVTSASALEMLGPHYRFQSRLGYSGEIAGDTLKGDLIIRGGGDPALGSEYFKDHYFFPHFLKTWAAQLKASGIQRIEGDLVLDGSWYDSEKVPATWVWEDLGNYYGAGSSALTVYDNLFRIRFRSPPNAGMPVEILSVYPDVDGLEFKNLVVSSDDSRDRAWVFGSPFDASRVIRGTIPRNRNRFTIKASNPFPERLLADDFLTFLAREGLVVTGQTAFRKTDPATFQQLFFTESPSLAEIIKVMNHESINLFAEHLVKQIAAETTGTGSRKTGLQLIHDYWKKKGLDTGQLFMEDGSGLSHFDAVTPAFLCDLLNYMSRESAHFSFFYESMPVPGDRTFYLFTPKLPPGTMMRAKSGSMTRVRSYAGYLETGSGNRYAFAVMVNHFSGTHGALISGLEQLFSHLDLK